MEAAELVAYLLDEKASLRLGYAGDKNPFGGKDEMIRDGQFVINPQFEWTGGGYL